MNTKVVLLVLVVMSFMTGCTPCSKGTDEEIAQCLRNSPAENIRRIPQVDKFLSQHKVYVSMTSSPKRMSKIVLVLKSLNLDLVEKVFISIPEKFRDRESYVIPDELRNFANGKVEILQGGEDLGPIMKLLPSVRRARELGDDNAIVITVDDDTGYDANLIAQLIKNAILYDAVVGSKGINVDNWNIDGSLWPEKTTRVPGCYSGHDFSYCDVLEGYGGVAYPVKFIDVEKLTTLSKLNRACKMSDDIVIPFGLAMDGVPRGLMTNVSFFGGVVQFAYGFEEDALHRGSGFLDMASSGTSSAARYLKCAQTMSEWRKLNET